MQQQLILPLTGLMLKQTVQIIMMYHRLRYVLILDYSRVLKLTMHHLDLGTQRNTKVRLEKKTDSFVTNNVNVNRCQSRKWKGVIRSLFDHSTNAIEAVSVTSKYPQDSGSVSCCYDYRVDVWLQNWVMHCILCIIGCIKSDPHRAE